MIADLVVADALDAELARDVLLPMIVDQATGRTAGEQLARVVVHDQRMLGAILKDLLAQRPAAYDSLQATIDHTIRSIGERLL